MYQLKKIPEDFVVREKCSLNLTKEGSYAICLMRKKNYTTIRAVEQIARLLRLDVKHIGYCGTKDKNAITKQYISLKNITEQKIKEFKIENISLDFLGYYTQPLHLGEHQGNQFKIVVRDVDQTHRSMLAMRKGSPIPNYFGEQRFSKHNDTIGRHIIKKEYDKAVSLILETNSDYSEKIRSYQTNYIAALQCIPLKLLKLYVHAYQSLLWNKTLRSYVTSHTEIIGIPLIGFGLEEIDPKIQPIIEEIMQQEQITPRDFISPQLPKLSVEGGVREAFVWVSDLLIQEKDPTAIKLTFTLPPSSYATVAVSYLLNSLEHTLKDHW